MKTFKQMVDRPKTAITKDQYDALRAKHAVGKAGVHGKYHDTLYATINRQGHSVAQHLSHQDHNLPTVERNHTTGEYFKYRRLTKLKPVIRKNI